MLWFFLQPTLGLSEDLRQGTQAWQIETSGYIGLRLLHHEGSSRGHTNPLTATALLKAHVKSDHDVLALQWRPTLVHAMNSGSSKASADVDEWYWEHRLSPVSFTFLGRRKIVNGVALGRNPSDFLNQHKPQDRILNDADRRAETIGDNMAGWSYFGQSYSIQSLLATPTGTSKRVRAMLQVNGNLNALSTDVSFIAYYADRPALGLNLSSVLGESTLLYTEAALRKGRDRQTPVLSTNGAVIGVMQDDKRWIADVVIGSQYTLGNGTTLTAEYWRNDNGFSNQEHAGIANTLTRVSGNPGLAGKLLSAPGLRRHSAFIRIGNIPLLDEAKGEITWIHNLDDSSRLLRSVVHWDIGEANSFRIGLDWFSGTPLSEYGASRIDKRVFLTYKRYF